MRAALNGTSWPIPLPEKSSATAQSGKHAPAHLLRHELLPRHVLERELREVGLLPLNLIELQLDGIVDHELDGGDWAGLPHSVLEHTSAMVLSESRIYDSRYDRWLALPRQGSTRGRG